VRSALRFAVFALLAAAAAVARAEDPPPAKPKHENKITPEAQAVLDRFRALLYTARDHGLESLKCTMFAAGFTSRERATLDYRPGDVKSWLPPAIQEEKKRLGLEATIVRYPYVSALDPIAVVDDYTSFDADVVPNGATTVVALTSFEDGVPAADLRFEFDESGLLTRRICTARGADRSEDCVATYTWMNYGDRHLLDELDVTIPTDPPGRHAFRFRYADAAGVRIPVSYDVTHFPPGASSRKFTLYVDDLTVNGKNVDLPKPWKHVGIAAADARAAIERAAKLVDKPADHGVKSVRAAFVQNGSPTPWRFRFESGRGHVDPAEGAEPTQKQRNDAGFTFLIPLRAAFEGPSIELDSETDAAFVDREGTRWLRISKWDDGERVSTWDYEFDSRGLIVRGVRDESGLSAELRFGWCPAGERFRVESVEFSRTQTGAETFTATRKIGWRDVAGTSLPTRVVCEYGDASAGPRGRRTVTFELRDVSINEAPPVADPNAHVNVVTPEARAALDRYERLIYRATDHGLRTATATLLPSGARLEVRNGRVSLTASVAAADSREAAPDRTYWMYESALTFALFGGPTAEGEFDAAFVERLGRRVLDVTDYQAGVLRARRELLFDDRGLVVSLRVRRTEPTSDEFNFQFVWRPVGDRWQVERVEAWSATHPWHSHLGCSFADVAGASIPTSIRIAFSNVGPGSRTLVAALTDLVVNGEPVTLPEPRMHENVVSKDAQALIDALDRAAYRATLRGLVTATGDLVVVGATPPTVGTFSFFPPGGIRVTTASSFVGDSIQSSAIVATGRIVLTTGLVGVRASESLEYDACVAESDGRRVLDVVEYRTGTRAADSRFWMDSNGLPERFRRREGPDPDTPTTEFSMAFEWERTGELWRISKFSFERPASPNVRSVYVLTYANVDGIDVPVAFDRAFGEEGALQQESWRLENLVINGKRFATPARTIPADAETK
jgi:hypothetical protein